MSAVARREETAPAPYEDPIPESKVDLVKRVFAKAASDDELALFMEVCRRTGLSPFARQVYCIKRWDSTQGREVMSIQTSIDGLRLIADRTGRYVPGREPTITYDKQGKPVSATSYVRKLVAGEWHEVGATAYYDEAVQTKKGGEPTHFWATMPRLMLAKVAEALALRKAFPAELSGLYTTDEMGGQEPPAPRVDTRTGEVLESGRSTPYADAVIETPTQPPPEPEPPALEPVEPPEDPEGPFALCKPRATGLQADRAMDRVRRLWAEGETYRMHLDPLPAGSSNDQWIAWAKQLDQAVSAEREVRRQLDAEENKEARGE